MSAHEPNLRWCQLSIEWFVYPSDMSDDQSISYKKMYVGPAAMIIQQKQLRNSGARTEFYIESQPLNMKRLK